MGECNRFVLILAVVGCDSIGQGQGADGEERSDLHDDGREDRMYFYKIREDV